MKSSELVRRFEQAGWVQIKQSSSHKIFKNPLNGEIVSVPFHRSKEVSVGLAYTLLKKLRKS